MGRKYTPPTDLIHLRAWVASSSPYTSTDHIKTPFPCVNDFTTPELEELLRYGLETFAELKTSLVLESAKMDSPVGNMIRPTLQLLTLPSSTSSAVRA